MTKTILPLSLLISSACATAPRLHEAPLPARHLLTAGRTHWSVGPSEAMDALCLVNALRGDAFYLRFQKPAYDEYAPLLNAEEKAALSHFSDAMHAADHLPSAYTTLVFSASPAENLADLIALTADESAWKEMLARYLASPQGEGDTPDTMNAVRADLQTLFAFLARVDFPGRWRKNELPKIEAAIAASTPQFLSSDVISWDESVLNRPLGVDTLRTDILAYVSPHGIRTTGWRFLSDVAFPPEVTIKTALHELLHPPFAREGELDARLVALEGDPFFQRVLKEHDPAFGYTSAKGFTEEDCAEAIDVAVSARHGLLTDPRTRKAVSIPAYFAEHDDGMHVLAFILATKVSARQPQSHETFVDLLLGLLRDGSLAPGNLENTFRATPGSYAVHALKER